ncbi:MAG: malonate--CoA ligase [Alphaproteobacteria bacterium]|jgi:malonyl-CoA/methylmalonyl-CoA synthetase
MTAKNHLFDQISAAITDPKKVFLETTDGGTLSYEGMVSLTGQYANALCDLGLKPGDRVAVQAEKSTAVMVLYLATVRAGGVFLPLNTGYTKAEITYFLGDATPLIFVCDPGNQPDYADMAKDSGVVHLETLDGNSAGTLADRALASSPDFENIARGADDLAAILYTSGTTGRSKGAMLSHENLASNARALVDFWRFTPDDVLLHALPIFHTHGLFVGTNVTLFSGASMVFMGGFDAGEIIRLMPKATVLMGVPTFYSRLLARDGFTRDVAQTMRLFISGSAPLSAELHKDFSARTSHAILERYGMTETNMNTSNPYDGDRRPGTVGFPLPGVELRISNMENGKILKTGEIGVIEVWGPNVFQGYWQMPEKTASEFREDGFFITGDMGVIDDDGYVSIVGRDKDLIITGGLNVYPAEVEAALDAINGVAESAIIGAPHSDFGEGVIAVVAPKPGASLTESGVIQTLSDCLAKFKQPKKVFFVNVLQRNTMGKIEKAKLRETYKDAF